MTSGSAPLSVEVLMMAGGGGSFSEIGVFNTCPDPNCLILLSDGSQKKAGFLQVGDLVKTYHENTFEYGDYEVTHVSIIKNSKKLKLIFEISEIICSDSHKFYVGNSWKESKDMVIGDVVSGQKLLKIEEFEDGDVVKITVADAHTYICEGLLSHNKADDDVGYVVGGGGGGAGGLYIYSATLDPETSRTVTIGGGGSGMTNGSATSFTGASNAVGGGYGTAQYNVARAGQPGGSGGGGASSGVGGSGTPGQGNPGGGSTVVNRGPWSAGGGGGKGGAGASGSPSGAGGAGGSGYDLATFRGGSPLIVAFGGGGAGQIPAIQPSVAPNGDGSTTLSPASNTGGGARCNGGNQPSNYQSSTAGGSGRVIVRYQGSTQKATGGTVTTATVGGTPYTIHDFTGNGTFSVT